jgi:hypothetical protein
MFGFKRWAGRATTVIAMTAVATLAFYGGGLAYASDVTVAVVDTTVPTKAVTLAPEASSTITINLTVTGNQEGIATFKVYQDWVLSGGNFAGSNPKTFTVPARAAQDDATTFTTTGTVSVAAGQADGPFTLKAGAFDITNTNTTGAKLDVGKASSYAVTVKTPAVTNTKPSVAVSGFTNGALYELGVDPLPTAMCVVTDDHDTVVPFPATLSSTLTHGLGVQTATCNYKDTGGLAANTAIATYTIVDTIAPTISHSLSGGTLNSNDWYNQDVTVTFTCSDVPGSGIQSCLGDTTLGEGTNQSVTGTATDWAGNTATNTASGINIDKTPPKVSLVGGPVDGASYYFGYVPAAPTCTASDDLSHLAGDCVVTGGGTTVGPQYYTATATDMAGNQATDTHYYTVSAWTLNGFYQPVDMNGVWNTVKGGSTVPLKFEVFAGSTELTDTSVVQSFTVKGVVCPGAEAATAPIEFVTTGGTSLRYDSTGGQFIQNWKTPTGAGKCYSTTMTTLDGSSITALFKIK